MNQIPFNPEPDGTSRTIKANYYKVSLANFVRGGGYGATAVAVLDSGICMEEQPERTSVRPEWDSTMPDGWESRRGRTVDNRVCAR